MLRIWRPIAALTILVLAVSFDRGYGQDKSWTCANQEPGCKSVFIVHNSWHAAIVMAKSDLTDKAMAELAEFPSASFIEFSWGDRDYFPNPNAGVFSAVKAALWSGGSVIHLVGFTDSVARFYPGATIIELRLSALAHRRLVDYLDDTFLRDASAPRDRAAPGLFPHSRFYPARRKFSLLRTCNTWVAEALEQAGLPITAQWVISAGNLHSQLIEASRPKMDRVN